MSLEILIYSCCEWATNSPNSTALKSEAGEATLFEPTMPRDEREKLYLGWRRAVERSRSWAEEDAAE